MNKQTHLDCKYFGYTKCPHRNEPLIKNFIADTEPIQSNIAPNQTEAFSKAPQIDKIFCENCTMFEAIKD